MNNTIQCPTCHRQHELFWLVRAGGKRELSYVCDRQEQSVKTTDMLFDGLRVKQATIRVKEPELVPDSIKAGLREVWTSGYKKEQRAKNQYQLVLMNEKDRA